MVFARRFSYVASAPLQKLDKEGSKKNMEGNDGVFEARRRSKTLPSEREHRCPTCGSCTPTLKERYASRLWKYSLLVMKVHSCLDAILDI